MRLLYKAWLESRARFLLGGVVLLAYCVSFVQQGRYNFPSVFEPSLPYSAFMWRGIYDGIDVLIFVIVAVMLGLGGLQPERAAGTAPFTLALPVTRLQLLGPRAVVALIEVAALSAIPLVVLPWVSHSIGRVYPVAQAWPFAVLFATTGAVWVSAGFLWSVCFTGEHTSTVASIVTPAVYAAVVNSTALRKYPAANIFNVMNGSRLPFLDKATALVTGPLPWTMLAVVALVAIGLFAAAAAVASRRDF